jgi:Phosphatidyl serine synthase
MKSWSFLGNTSFRTSASAGGTTFSWILHSQIPLQLLSASISYANLASKSMTGWAEKVKIVSGTGASGDGKYTYNISLYNSHRLFGTFCYAQFFLGVQFLMNFFVMNAFLIPPKHFFPIGRLLLWFAFGNVAFKEGWMDVKTWNTVERKDNPVEGRHRWLAVAILATECLIVWKYRYGTGNLIFADTPAYIWVPWTIVLVGCFGFWLYLRFLKEDRTKKFIEPYEAAAIQKKITAAGPVVPKKQSSNSNESKTAEKKLKKK